MSAKDLGHGAGFVGELSAERAEILTPEAVAFVAGLVRRFRGAVAERLAARAARKASGASLRFLPETRAVREGGWRCAPLPASISTAASRSPARSTAR
jgi:malate synthase